MATAEQIASADTARKRPHADAFSEHAIALVRGSGDAEEHDRAARLAWRAAPDVAEMFGLPRPPVPASIVGRLGADTLDGLHRALWLGDDEGRAFARDLTAIEALAAREALTARREGREAS